MELTVPLLFQFPNNMDSIIISLRSITSYFLVSGSICDLHCIKLVPLQDSSSKLIEIVKDKNMEYTYFEHPLSFRLEYTNMQPFSFLKYIGWIENCISLSHRYPVLEKVLKTFYSNEILTKLNTLQSQLLFLEHTVPFFEQSMITPFFNKKLQFEGKTTDFMKTIDWKIILYGHVNACQILYSQISSPKIREKIILSVFTLTKVLKPRLEKILHDPNKLQSLIIDFKREVHKIVNESAAFVNLKDISFRSWLLSLCQFLMYCVPFEFPIENSLTHLNMILYLCFGNDEIQPDQNICFVSENKKKRKLESDKVQKLRQIHPFVRNIYHPIFTS